VSTQQTRGSGARRPGEKKSAGRSVVPGAKPSRRAIRERQAAQRALVESRRLREKRNRRLWAVLVPIVVTVLAVTAMVAAKLSSDGTGAGMAATAAGATVIAQVSGVPPATFDAVGAGKPTALPAQITGAPLIAGGKPRVLYVGAEYCPFCAVERWPLIVALSRFGTWHGLRYAFSAAAPEVYPNTETFTFHGASYTSKWLSFTAVETHTSKRQGNGYEALDALRGADLDVFQAQNKNGYTPFIALGGRFVITGATYDPESVTGKTQAQIAATLRDPASHTGAAVDGAANVITAALCTLTGGQPSNVCASPGVTAAAKMLR
jgi:hypothetical protein